VATVLPTTFGAILNAIATGIARLDQTPTPDLRMADFAQFIVAAEPALPWPPGAFLAACQRNRSHAVAALADGDLVATAVRNLIETRDMWTGLKSDLYETLSMSMSPEVRRSGDWPGNARWFADRLRRAAPTLRTLGIDVVERRSGQGITVNIGKIAAPATFATSSKRPGHAERDVSVASVASVAKSHLLTEASLGHAADADGPEPPAATPSFATMSSREGWEETV